MSVLICTPCYGGMVTEPYLRSYSTLEAHLHQANVPHALLTLGNESLVTRARNTCAATFLRETNFERLFFIDADIEFTSEDFAKVLNLCAATNEVTVGVYRMKTPDSVYAAWVNGKLVDDLDQFTEPMEVDYAGTGFMCIPRTAFKKFRDAHPEIEHEEGKVGTSWDFFQAKVVGIGKDAFYCSEDYSFCREHRRLGGKVIMDPSVRLTHWGTAAYGRDS